MLPPIAYHAALTGLVRRHRRATRAPDAGYSTEAVVVIALLVAAAIVVIGILTVNGNAFVQRNNLGILAGTFGSPI